MSDANELLLPRTDAGAGVQVLVTIALTVGIAVLVGAVMSRLHRTRSRRGDRLDHSGFVPRSRP